MSASILNSQTMHPHTSFLCPAALYQFKPNPVINAYKFAGTKKQTELKSAGFTK